MKLFLVFTLSQLFLSNSHANGAGLSLEKKARGTAGVDEEYVDEIKHRQSALERQEVPREKMKKNPRNPAFSESFEKVDSEKAEQQREEERKAAEHQKSREGER